MQSIVKHSQRLVIKVGSSLVTNQGKGLDHDALALWAAQIAQLKAMGKEILLVSSGAVAEGMARLGWDSRPAALHDLQAAAAVTVAQGIAGGDPFALERRTQEPL